MKSGLVLGVTDRCFQARSTGLVPSARSKAPQRTALGSIVHCRIFESGRLVVILLKSPVEIRQWSLYRILIFSTNSANGSLQSIPVSRPENRQRQVRVGYGRPVPNDERRFYDLHRPFTPRWPV